MRIKEIAVLYALNSLALSEWPDRDITECTASAREITDYIRRGFRYPGQTNGVCGPLEGLRWRPKLQEVVGVLNAMRGVNRWPSWRRKDEPLVDTYKFASGPNRYRMSKRGLRVICT